MIKGLKTSYKRTKFDKFWILIQLDNINIYKFFSVPLIGPILTYITTHHAEKLFLLFTISHLFHLFEASCGVIFCFYLGINAKTTFKWAISVAFNGLFGLKPLFDELVRDENQNSSVNRKINFDNVKWCLWYSRISNLISKRLIKSRLATISRTIIFC